TGIAYPRVLSGQLAALPVPSRRALAFARQSPPDFFHLPLGTFQVSGIDDLLAGRQYRQVFQPQVDTDNAVSRLCRWRGFFDHRRNEIPPGTVPTDRDHLGRLFGVPCSTPAQYAQAGSVGSVL